MLAGCGGGESLDDTSDFAKPAPAVTDVELRLDPDGPGGKRPRTATVRCEGSNGTSSPACPLVDRLPDDATAPPPPETPCTEIFGGPDELTIEGILRGARVAATLTRANGCEIDRFDRFAALTARLFPGYTPGESLRP